MVYWHIDADIISLVVLVMVYVYNRKLNTDSSDAIRMKRFVRCLRIGILMTLVDIAASVVMDISVSRFTYHLFMTLYFAVIEFAIVAWLIYATAILFDNEKQRKRVEIAAIIPYGAYALLAFSNPWTGFIYKLGPNCEYSRGSLFYLMVVFYALYTLVLFGMIVLRRKYVPVGYSPYVLVAIPIILAVSIAVQLLIPGWLMILPGYMISMVLAFLFLQSKRSRESQVEMQSLSVTALTDQLTGLFNRAGMEQKVKQALLTEKGNRFMVAVVDVDDLKTINDTMGHYEGDRALQAIANQLKAHFRATDVIARFGGDEFVIYLIGDMSDIQAHSNLKRLVEEMASLKIGEKNDYPIHGSVGAVFGIVGKDEFYSMCSHADAALYYVKQNGKCGYALYEPSMENTVFDRKNRDGGTVFSYR